MSSTYYRRKALGVCPRCNGKPAATKVHCSGCLNDMKEYKWNALAAEDKVKAVARRALKVQREWWKKHEAMNRHNEIAKFNC